MSRLIIAIGLLAAAATAANYVEVDCGYVTSCDDCVQEDDVTSRDNYLERCEEKLEKKGDPKNTYYFRKVTCDGGKLVYTNYSDIKCETKEGSSSPQQCEAKSDSIVKYVQLSGSTVKECGRSSDCSGSCTEYNVNKGKENECQVWTRTEGTSTKTGGYKWSKKGGKDHLAVYSSEHCRPNSLLFQGLLNSTCNKLTKTTKYQCGSSIKDEQATSQSCGYVSKCGDCSATVESSTVSINKCEMSSDESSTMGTCSGGTATYSDGECKDKQYTKVYEGCHLGDTKKYVKVSGNTFYMCGSKDECDTSDGCTKYTGSVTTGECTNEKKDGSYFSYKLKVNGDKKHLTVYTAPNCDSKLLYQGELEDGKCVEVRQATKTTCGAAGAVALVAAAAAAAALLL